MTIPTKGELQFMPQLSKAQEQAILRSQLYAFFVKTLPDIMPGVKYLPNWHILAMCHVIERMIFGDDRRLIINIQPRMGKSLLLSVALPMFLLMLDATQQIMCLSYSESLAGQFHQLSRILSRKKWYRDLNPDLKFKSTGDDAVFKDTADALQTTQMGFRLSKSMNGSITGHGANWLILDDPNDMNQINSDSYRQKVKDTFDQTLASRLNNDDGRILIVTQRGHIDDLTGHLLEKGGFKQLVIQAEATEDQTFDLGHGQVYRRKKGDLLHPVRFGAMAMAERRRDLGSLAFEAQYQQNPQPPEGNLFKKQWLTYADVLPEFQYIVISGDIAQTLGGGDYSAFIVWGVHEKRWYVLGAYRAQLNLPAAIRFYRKLDEEYEPDFTCIETNGPGQGFIDRLCELKYRHVGGTSVAGDKIVRAMNISPLLESEMVLFDPKMPGHDPFMSELLSFPSSKHDDWVDAFGLALNLRGSILSEANRFRRKKRRHLPGDNGNSTEYNIYGIGERETFRDNDFDYLMRGNFNNLRI